MLIAFADMLVAGERLWLTGLVCSLWLAMMFLAATYSVLMIDEPAVGEIGIEDWFLTPIILWVILILIAMSLGRMRLFLGFGPLKEQKFKFPYRRGILFDGGGYSLVGFAWGMNLLGIPVSFVVFAMLISR